MPKELSNSRVYYPQVDVLRFIAFLLVMLSHLRAVDGSYFSKFIHWMGAYGVDMFFVISAFLLFDLLFKEFQRKGRINAPFFFLRRVLRIFPLYYFALLAITLYSVFVLDQPLDGKRLLGLATFLENFSILSSSSYPSTWGLGHLWTISLEEQFYLFVPLISLLLIKLKPRSAFVFLACMFVASIALRAIGLRSGLEHPTIWTMHVFRLEPFVLGFLIGYLHNKYSILDRFAWGGLIIAFVITCVGYGLKGAPWPTLHPHNLWPIMFVAVVWSGVFVFVLAKAEKFPAFFCNRALAFLGKISFGLYIWHQFAIELCKKYVMPALNSGAPWNRNPHLGEWSVQVISAFILTLAMALASYYVIERPFLRLKKKFTLVENR